MEKRGQGESNLGARGPGAPTLPAWPAFALPHRHAHTPSLPPTTNNIPFTRLLIHPHPYPTPTLHLTLPSDLSTSPLQNNQQWYVHPHPAFSARTIANLPSRLVSSRYVGPPAKPSDEALTPAALAHPRPTCSISSRIIHAACRTHFTRPLSPLPLIPIPNSSRPLLRTPSELFTALASSPSRPRPPHALLAHPHSPTDHLTVPARLTPPPTAPDPFSTCPCAASPPRSAPASPRTGCRVPREVPGAQDGQEALLHHLRYFGRQEVDPGVQDVRVARL